MRRPIEYFFKGIVEDRVQRMLLLPVRRTKNRAAASDIMVQGSEDGVCEERGLGWLAGCG